MITKLESCGFPPHIEHVTRAAEFILTDTVGEHWITRFLNRHAGLATKLTSPLEQDRVEAEDPQIIQDHFAKVHGIISTKIIQQKTCTTWMRRDF